MSVRTYKKRIQRLNPTSVSSPGRDVILKGHLIGRKFKARDGIYKIDGGA